MPQHKGKISKMCKFHSKEKVQKSYHVYFKATHYKTQFVPATLQEKNHLKFLVMTLVPAQRFY